MSGQPPPSPPPPGPPPSGPPPPYLPAPYPPGAPPPRRRRGLAVAVSVVAAVLVLVTAVAVPLLVRASGEGASREPRSAPEADRPTGPPTLDEVIVHDDLRTDHVEGDVDYGTVPPAGGPHDAEWLECGSYDEPVRDENAVHDLEHGTVWITYDPDLPEAEVATLEEQLPDNGILSPYDGLPAPVVVTVWERQLHLVGADDPRLPLFVAELGGGATAPEPYASCAGGITDPSGETGVAV